MRYYKLMSALTVLHRISLNGDPARTNGDAEQTFEEQANAKKQARADRAEQMAADEAAKKAELAAEKEALQEARRVQEERAKAGAERAARLEQNDETKVQSLKRGVAALESAAEALAPKLLPEAGDLPDMGDWLATKNLGELAASLQDAELDLRTLLQTAEDCDAKSFDDNFRDFVPQFGKRRKLHSEAKTEYIRLAKAFKPPPPPTPPPRPPI